MINTKLLDVIISIELSLLVLSLGLFFAHGLWLYFFRRRAIRNTEIGRAALLSALDRVAKSAGAATQSLDTSEEVALLRRLPEEQAASLFLEIACYVSGAAATTLREISVSAGVTRRARKMCRSRRWPRRLGGARILSILGEKDSIISTLLHDEEPAIRAQAAEWGASFPTHPLIEEMLYLLDDAEALSRFAVQDALLRMGLRVVPQLAEFLNSASGTGAVAALKVAAAIPAPAFLDVALSLSSNADSEIRSAAAKVLGAVGGERAAARLVEMLRDGVEEVQGEAAAALGKMRYWPAATDLSDLLRHPAWRVRHASGLALRSIGGPAILLLRRAAKGDDALASSMGQLILGLPEAAR